MIYSQSKTIRQPTRDLQPIKTPASKWPAITTQTKPFAYKINTSFSTQVLNMLNKHEDFFHQKCVLLKIKNENNVRVLLMK